jgi:hypothetical protein
LEPGFGKSISTIAEKNASVIDQTPISVPRRAFFVYENPPNSSIDIFLHLTKLLMLFWFKCFNFEEVSVKHCI